MRRTLPTLVLPLAVVTAASAQVAPHAPKEGEHIGMMDLHDGREIGMMARMDSLDQPFDGLRLAMAGSLTTERSTRWFGCWIRWSFSTWNCIGGREG